MKVSFIIPIYKVERYLEQCVDSILTQTYRDIEVILVDDDSPDHCPEMCDDYAVKDSRVKVLHKSNGGLSDARNVGLQIATGDFVVFMDGDDFWTGDKYLEQLMHKIGENPDCDFIGFNCSYYFPESNTYKNWPAYFDVLQRPILAEKALCELIKSGTFPMSACLKIMKKDFLVANKLYFEKGIIAEDIPWFINVLEQSNKCMFTNQYIYAYRQNVSGSITNSGGERSFKNLFAILQKEIEMIDNRQFSEDAKNALYSFLAYEYCILLSMLGELKEIKTKRKELYSYKWLLRFIVNPKVRKVNLVYRFLGIRITEWILRFYNKRRESQR